MSYSTLKEAYGEDTFSRKKNKKIKEEFTNDYSNMEECYYKENYKIDTGSCPEKFTNNIINPNSSSKDNINNKKEISKIHNIEPFYDDDLNKYFKLNEDNGINELKEFKEDIKEIKKKDYNNDNKIKTKTKQDIYDKNYIYLGLFILIGILIIVLCELLTRVAINIGMRKAIMILEPYLKEIKDI